MFVREAGLLVSPALTTVKENTLQIGKVVSCIARYRSNAAKMLILRPNTSLPNV